MKITAKTRKSHYWNEDRFVIGKDFLMVIDGATPLIKKSIFNEACWLVNYIKKNIEKYQGSIKERLYQISIDAYNALPVKIKEEDYLPSASLSYIEWDDEYYYAYTLGDCEVTFITKDNQIIRCYSDDLCKLDNIALNELIKIAKEKNIDNAKARPFINDILIKHRKLINKENGYTAFALTDKPIISTKEYKILKENVKEIYIYSDGFSQSFESLDIYKSHEEMFKKSLDIENEISKIVDVSFNDPFANKYPRFKKIDDITVIKVEN